MANRLVRKGGTPPHCLDLGGFLRISHSDDVFRCAGFFSKPTSRLLGITADTYFHIGLSFFKRTDQSRSIIYNVPPSCGGAGLVSVVASTVLDGNGWYVISAQRRIRIFGKRFMGSEMRSIFVQGSDLNTKKVVFFKNHDFSTGNSIVNFKRFAGFRRI